MPVGVHLWGEATDRLAPGGRVLLTDAFAGELSLRSGTEVYHRATDPETQGIQQIGSKEWVRVTAAKAGGMTSP